LQNSLRQADYLARLGEDEFGVILDNIPISKVTQVVSQKLMTQFDTPYVVENETIQLAASIGAGHYPVDGDHAEALLLFADQACKAKKS
jgi:diguanylate cyclase (GGDEF)-like protein